MFPVQFITTEPGPYLRRVQIAKLPFKLFFTNSISLVPKTQKEKLAQRIESKKIFVKFPAKGICGFEAFSFTFHSCFLQFCLNGPGKKFLPLPFKNRLILYLLSVLLVICLMFLPVALSALEKPCLTNCLQNKYVMVFTLPYSSTDSPNSSKFRPLNFIELNTVYLDFTTTSFMYLRVPLAFVRHVTGMVRIT
jgi:hypothetical protein